MSESDEAPHLVEGEIDQENDPQNGDVNDRGTGLLNEEETDHMERNTGSKTDIVTGRLIVGKRGRVIHGID
jgi:hypothetical protein